MIIADRLKHKNRAEYLLYMWQVEDILRAYGCDADRIKTEYVARFALEGEELRRVEQWYEDLCRMMVEEGLREKGHLQINRNALQELTELHGQLLASTRYPFYREMYYKVLPYIVELRSKGGGEEEPELQTCLEALYGVLMLRLQKKEVSEATAKAAADISTFLGQLSDYCLKDRQEPLEF